MLLKSLKRHYQSLLLQKNNTHLKVQLNEPKTKNALSINMINELNELFEELKKNEFKTVSFESSESGHFCTGANLKERLKMNEDDIEEFVKRLRSTFQKIYSLDQVTYALIDGYCLGGGLELALACDFRLATKNSLIGLPETSLAIIPGAGGTQRLSRIAGFQVAKKFIYYGLKMTAGEIKERNYQFIDEVYDDGDQMQEKLNQFIKQLDKAGPLGLLSAKKAIQDGFDQSIEDGLGEEEKNYRRVLKSEDRLEALEAFKEKRKPNFKGK